MIGKLQRVPLRAVWKHEAHDFTIWLEENIDVLNGILDITLVSVQRERRTESSFSVDLVAEDENGNTVIIENQLERSDHKHLGQLITYQTAMDAKSAIWIVSDPRPEHVGALHKLNESGLARFYLLKVEAFKIGDSAPAPLMTVIVEPSETLSLLGEVNSAKGERDSMRESWWTQLLERQDASLHSGITAGPHSYIGTSSGVRGLSFNYAIRQNDCSVELYIDRGTDKSDLNQAIFEELQAHKNEIESAFGANLSWEALEAKRACRIKYAIDGGYKSAESDWQRIQAAQVDAMNRLHKALAPFIRELDVKEMESLIEEAYADLV
tara:strand:+ start:5985 stop:6956 length:972 start_codon:yes stop_codon:yes gene_type:complete